MKDWFKEHKWQLLVLMLAGIVIYLFIDGLKKDHSMDLVKQEIKLKEQARQEIIETRKAWEKDEKEKDALILSLKIRDSVVAIYSSAVDQKLIQLPKKYNEKINEIFYYSSPELLDYFSKLPATTGNDY